MQPNKCAHNYSDLGLAQYNLGLQSGNKQHFETAFKYCRQALEVNPNHADAMVNMGLIYKH